MKNGIPICGLNGVGKTTFGCALASRLGIKFIDAEELYFSATDSEYPYSMICIDGTASIDENIKKTIEPHNKNRLLYSRNQQ